MTMYFSDPRLTHTADPARPARINMAICSARHSGGQSCLWTRVTVTQLITGSRKPFSRGVDSAVKRRPGQSSIEGSSARSRGGSAHRRARLIDVGKPHRRMVAPDAAHHPPTFQPAYSVARPVRPTGPRPVVDRSRDGDPHSGCGGARPPTRVGRIHRPGQRRRRPTGAAVRVHDVPPVPGGGVSDGLVSGRPRPASLDVAVAAGPTAASPATITGSWHLPAARWTSSLTIRTAGWPSGDYLLRLDSDVGLRRRFVPLTVQAAPRGARWWW